MSLVCVDVGTSVVKAVGYDDAAREAAVARRPSPVARPRPGHAEQDPRAVWAAVVSAVREVVAAVGAPHALAVTAQGDGAWLVDAAGEPTGPAVLWNDGRAGAVVDRWERDGVLAAAFAVNGNRTTAGHANAVLAWLDEHDDERLARAAALLSCGGWVFRCLTGVVAVDTSDASAPFLDPRTGAWSEELLELHGLAHLRHLLPPLRRDDERVAALAPDAAGTLGLPAGLPVVMAPYDVCTTALGAGAVAAGDATGILGTTISTQVVLDRVAPATAAPGTAGAGLTVALGAPGRWLRAHATLAGADVLDWAAGLLGLAGAVALVDLAATAPVGADGLRFLPHLSPAGERAPFVDPAARGSLHGLTVGHDRAAVARAVVEGLALSVRECLDLLAVEGGRRPERLTACGGAAASDVLVQAVADATGVEVRRCRDREVGARGAALVAAVALGEEPDVATAATRQVRHGAAVTPAGGHDWSARLREQQALRAAVAPTWRRSS